MKHDFKLKIFGSISRSFRPHKRRILMVMTLILSSLLCYKCTNTTFVDHNDEISNTKIKPRTCEAGSLTIENGRIVFDDSIAYFETIEFLSCATPEDIEDWSSEIAIETSGKVYREFIDLICEDELSDQGFRDLLEEYEGKILADEVYEDGIYSYQIDPLFPALNEIFNLDGEFQIDTSIYKCVGNKFFSIISPSLVDPATVNIATTTDTINKLFAHSFTPTTIVSCCPSSHESTHYYDSSPRKRLRQDYYVVDLTIVFPSSLSGLFHYRAGTGIDIRAKSQKRKGFIITWWTCHNINHTWEFDISYTHNFSAYGIPNPATFDYTVSSNSECTEEHGNGYFGLLSLGFAKEVPPALSVCVTDVFEEFINLGANGPPSVTYDCD